MANQNAPFGFGAITRTGSSFDGSLNRYFIPDTDGVIMAVGDPVITAGGADADDCGWLVVDHRQQSIHWRAVPQPLVGQPRDVAAVRSGHLHVGAVGAVGDRVHRLKRQTANPRRTVLRQPSTMSKWK